MSNFLAPATVTAVLERTLQQALDSALPGASAAAGRPRGDGDDAPGVVIYLAQVGPSAPTRNMDLPTRSSGGTVVCRPQVALDLDYLFLCYGASEQLEPERVGAVVASALHAQPIITDAQIAAVVAEATDPDSPTHEYLQGTDLAQQN